MVEKWPEISFQEAKKIMMGSVIEIRKSGMGRASEIAGSVADKVGQTLFFAPKKPIDGIFTSTGFDLVEVPEFGSGIHTPVMLVDIKEVLAQRSDVLTTDLVRTLAVADQYPEKFARRYSEVYADAFAVQREWLGSAPAVAFDPRLNDEEHLRRELLGDAKYYSDVGFDDWQAAIDEYSQLSRSIPQRSRLKKLRPDTSEFLIMRHVMTAKHHESAQQTLGDKFFKADADERARITAMIYMGIALNASQSPMEN